MSRYDRQLLLLGAKRHQVLELWEVERYGTDSFGDPHYVSIFGMRPAEWHARGVRLLGRTAVECTRDALGAAIGRDIASIASTGVPSGATLVVDPFAGSGNTLHWIMRCLPGAGGVGFELDPIVFELTKRNLAALALPIELVNTNHQAGLAGVALGADQLLITFIAPPWGEALSEAAGLDLRRTTPPITEIVGLVIGQFAANPLLCAIQVFETTTGASINELALLFDWSALRIYDVNAPGQNHGILIGTTGWVPRSPV